MEEQPRSAPSPAPSTSPSMLAIRDLQVRSRSAKRYASMVVAPHVKSTYRASTYFAVRIKVGC